MDALINAGFPSRGIIADIFPDAGQFIPIADNVFVIIPLPHGHAGGAAGLVDARGDGGFLLSDDGSDGFRYDGVFSNPLCRRGDPMGRSYGIRRIHFVSTDGQYSMNVVWHYHEFVQFHKMEMIGNCGPIFCGDIAKCIQPHFSAPDFPARARAAARDDRDEIRTRAPALQFILPSIDKNDGNMLRGGRRVYSYPLNRMDRLW
jgi:hypothetical protein